MLSTLTSDRKSEIKKDLEMPPRVEWYSNPDNFDVLTTNTSSNDELNTYEIDKDTETANERGSDPVLIDLLKYNKKTHIGEKCINYSLNIVHCCQVCD